MGAGVSNWRLARAVSWLGPTGRRGRHGPRRDPVAPPAGWRPGPATSAGPWSTSPFPDMARKILDAYFIPGGRDPAQPYLICPACIRSRRNIPAQELCIAANFVEVFLAREGHAGPVGINFLEKIQMPHLPSLYGAMLAGVAVVIVGAGIPMEFPAAIAALAGAPAGDLQPECGRRPARASPSVMTLDPATFHGVRPPLPPLATPAFLPIVSSSALATMLVRRVQGDMAGFIIEGPLAGGHNAPPRGQMKFTADGQPIYGSRDVVDLEVFRQLGLPFWLAGAYGTPGEAAGSPAPLAPPACRWARPSPCAWNPALRRTLRRALVAKALAGNAKVYTDPKASPTGFPFKVAELEGTLSDDIRLCPAAAHLRPGLPARSLPQARTAPSATAAPPNPRRPISPKGGSPEDLARPQMPVQRPGRQHRHAPAPGRRHHGTAASSPWATISPASAASAPPTAPTTRPPTSSAPFWDSSVLPPGRPTRPRAAPRLGRNSTGAGRPGPLGGFPLRIGRMEVLRRVGSWGRWRFKPRRGGRGAASVRCDARWPERGRLRRRRGSRTGRAV